MRSLALLIVLILVAPLSLGPTGAANELAYEYVLAPTVAVPGLRTNIALCDDPDEPCIGGVLFPVSADYVSATPDDHLLGTNVGLLLCVWEHEGGSCRAGDHFDGAACGSRSLIGFPSSVHSGAAFIYGIHVGVDLSICGASQGNLYVGFT